MDPTTSPYRLPKIVLLLAVAFGAAHLGAAPTTAPVSSTGAEIYFKPPQFTGPVISPDGHSIGFISQVDGRAGLFKIDRTSGQIQTLFTAGEGELARFWWAGNQRVLIAARGVRAIEYFVLDLNNPKPRAIHALDGRDPTQIVWLPADNDHVIAINKRVDLTNGHSSTVESMSADYQFVYSPAGELRAKLGQALGKWRISWRSRTDRPWHTLESSNEDWPPFTVAAVADDDRHLWVYANDQGDTEALMLLDPDTDQRTLVAQRPNQDIYDMMVQPPRMTAAAVVFYNNGPEDAFFMDEQAKQFSSALDQSLPGMLHRVTSSSTDGTARVIAAWIPGYPWHYYLFDATQHRLSMLGEERPDIVAGGLGEVHFFSFQTRDGLNESGYVVLPRKAKDGKPVPLLVMSMAAVGERAKSATYFDAEDQFFASRGYGVAHFAVRGNIGFGRKLERAGDFQLASAIVRDLEDGVGYLAREHLIDPHRVAIMGYGLGGLAALHTAATSNVFHAVVAYSPRCDLTATSIDWLSSSHAEIPTIVKQAGGTKAAYDMVHQFEPESFVDRLSVPALLACSSSFGATTSQALQIRGSLDRHHKTYEWYQLDFDAADHVKWEVYNGRFFTKVADYLDRTLQ